MKKGIIIGLVAGILIGIVGYRIWADRTSVARHWESVRKFNKYMRDPGNYNAAGKGPDGKVFTAASLPFDVSTDLAALVAAGELKHSDIVLQTLVYPNREATRHWMSFCEGHPDEIVYAEGAAEPGPFHLNFWFTPAGEPLVTRLVEELKAMGSKSEPTTSGTVRR